MVVACSGRPADVKEAWLPELPPTVALGEPWSSSPRAVAQERVMCVPSDSSVRPHTDCFQVQFARSFVNLTHAFLRVVLPAGTSSQEPVLPRTCSQAGPA